MPYDSASDEAIEQIVSTYIFQSYGPMKCANIVRKNNPTSAAKPNQLWAAVLSPGLQSLAFKNTTMLDIPEQMFMRRRANTCRVLSVLDRSLLKVIERVLPWHVETLIMSKVNGEKARAAIAKRRRTAQRVKSRASRVKAAAASAKTASAEQ